MSAVYANFFTPHTISLLLCLHELQKKAQANQVDLRSVLVQHLLQKILDLSDASQHAETNFKFQAQMFKSTQDAEFLKRYQEIVGEIDSFNKFYGEISNMLKSLRSIRNSKLEQSNIIDFFVRRLYIYFQKLDFKEIVGIYERFGRYVKGQPLPTRQHQFMLTKSIEEVKFNLENYPAYSNPEEIMSQIDALAADDHTFKTSYLKGLASAQMGLPMQSAHYFRRYFDKNLGNLFHDRLMDGSSGNKINHCILTNAYAGLQLGHLDQCLQSISEGLRISQNNADEESINNCIIYLYSIAEKLGKFQEQILLAEHAITHSLNQSNLTLTLYSCLACSLFEKKYDCGDSSLSLLKTREVSWKDALHFSKKKLHSQFQNNCRNIYHTHRNLLIPNFIHKLAVLCHLPVLEDLLINPYYQRPELLELNIYKQFKGQNQLQKKLQEGKRYLDMGCNLLLKHNLIQINNILAIKTPQQHLKIEKLKIEIQFQEGSLMKCFHSTQNLLKFARENGFMKSDYVQILIVAAKILYKNELYFDAMVQIEEALKICQKHCLDYDKLYCEILKAQILLEIDHISTPIQILQSIQERGELTRLEGEPLRIFYEVKLKINQHLLSFVSQSAYKQIVEKNVLECYEKIFTLLVQEGKLIELKKILTQILIFVERHPVYLSKSNNIKKILAVCDSSLQILSKTQIKVDENMSKKVMEKIRRMY